MVQDKAGALEMVQAAFESPVSCIGIDTEYRFTEDQPIRLRSSKDNWHDIRSTRPFCVALAIVSSGRMLRFVVDVRVNDLLPLVQQVLDLPVPFASHYAKAELFAHLVTRLARTPHPLGHAAGGEGACLGGCPLRARVRRSESDEEAVRLKEDATAREDQSLSLDATAARYGVVIPRASAKATLQSSFLTKPLDAPLTQIEVEYCAADAQATAEIRILQRLACDRAGICEVLDRVVMPWNVTAAEIQWTGVLLDRDKCRAFLDASASPASGSAWSCRPTPSRNRAARINCAIC